ncbi:MAG TPA: hypothetical protein VGL35_10720 [Rhizomicrobium sp.]|jgi:hypothetical protein
MKCFWPAALLLSAGLAVAHAAHAQCAFAHSACEDRTIAGSPGVAKSAHDLNAAIAEFRGGDPDGAIALLTRVLSSEELTGDAGALAHYDRGMI